MTTESSSSSSLPCSLTGHSLLASPYYNKGSVFTPLERKTFSLNGLLPYLPQSHEQQLSRAYSQYQKSDTFYSLILSHLTEMLPIIYTPTEAEAIKRYSRLFRRPDGVFLNIEMSDQEVEDALKAWEKGRREIFGDLEETEETRYVVVSDGEQVLGVGDQGIGGIAIAEAKGLLMTLCGGLHPGVVCPVGLDCGTDNEDLRGDELYLGLKHGRVRGEKYDRFIESFVKAVKKLFPRAVLHFEDFGVMNARRLLETYREKLPCFNDDVQGTGVVTLGAMMAAAKVTKVDLKEMRILIFGAGSAGVGIADMLVASAVEDGVDEKEACKNIWMVDKNGLLLESSYDLRPVQKPYAKPDSDWQDKDTKDLTNLISIIKPHALIGVSTIKGAFTESAVKEMAKHVERPIIFPLSNPTSLHEAVPEDLIKWTESKALIATGSPFPPVEHDGKRFEIAENNNSVVFPAIGLAAVIAEVEGITDGMLVEAARRVAGMSPALDGEGKALLPDVEQVREVVRDIAVGVVKKAQEEKLVKKQGVPEDEEKLKKWVEERMWKPEYRELKKV
ncbi:putative malate dehydrogenase [Pyronema omphalodes]|nr:putative malate dehydrogenase [Pyronema omphalodes]